MKGTSVEAKTKSNNYTVEVSTNYKKVNPGKKDIDKKVEAALKKCESKLGKYNIEENHK